MKKRIDPNVFSIPPGAPFLPTLVDSILSGRLIAGFAPRNDPLALSDLTIWVPTRRAARELTTDFIDRLNCKAALLPMIRTLGDVDEDDFLFGANQMVNAGLDAVPVSSMERQLKLAVLIESWAQNLNVSQRALFDGAEILVPSSSSDAVWFAADLAHLMDTVATEEVGWSELSTLVPKDYAQWWELTLEFLKIATIYWPDHLSETGQTDASLLRVQNLRNQAELYKTGNSGPVIAAGSTGSIPATADLLKAVSRLDQGAVVLPGLDRDMPDQVWPFVDLPDNDRDDFGTAPGHPQFGLKRLIDHIGVSRSDVKHLEVPASQGSERLRESIVGLSLLPSEATGLWHQKKTEPKNTDLAFGSVSLIEAENEREEALAIAIALRETLEQQDATAALVTPDRNLARRVAVELRRFGLNVDDSAGQPLSNRPHGTLLRTVLQVAFGEADNTALASLIAHPLARFGMSLESARQSARMLELLALRGTLTPTQPATILPALNAQLDTTDKHRVPPVIARMSADDVSAARSLGEKIEEIFRSQNADSFAEFVTLTISTLEAVASDEAGNLIHLYGGEEGQALCEFLEDLRNQQTNLTASRAEWPGLIDALLPNVTVRPHGGTHPRLSILGPIEARLQTFDRVVLGGLNEKVWPATTANDPFLSRPMKAAMKLPPPERRTGLAAHDFQMLLGMKGVVMTRSQRAENAPTVASRWLQRLLLVSGEQTAEAMRSRGSRYLKLAQQMDAMTTQPKAVERPAPKPDLSARPRRLSFTEIETWIKDPYAIYAKHVLALKPLEPLSREADVRDRGILYHGILEEFVKRYRQDDSQSAENLLHEITTQKFKEQGLPEEKVSLWLPRFTVIAGNFLDWHLSNAKHVTCVFAETRAYHQLTDVDFTITGIADRIDIDHSGGAAIYDYKTGGEPKIGRVKELSAPQLPLEAGVLVEGGFEGITSTHISDLAYVRLQPGDSLKIDSVGSGRNPVDPMEIAASSIMALKALIRIYDNPEKPYLSKARAVASAEQEGDYDHLARVREWSTARQDET